jgi:hypothetical protein
MRKHRIVSLVAALLVLLALAAVSSTRSAQKESAADNAGMLAGGIKDVPANENDLQLQELARFAVNEHNQKAVSPLPFFAGLVPLLYDVPVFCCVVVWCSRF